MAGARKHKKKLFYPIFFSVLLLGVIGAIWGMSYLTGVLAEYEASMPKYTADKVAEPFLAGDFARAYDDYARANTAGRFDADYRGEYLKRLEALASGHTVACKEGFSADPGTRVYKIKADSELLATFTLKTTGAKTAHGFDSWAFDEATFVELPASERVIVAPTWYTVSVNGVTLTEEDKGGEDERTASCDHMPKNVEGLIYRTYRVELFDDSPDVRVTDEAGAEVQLTTREDGALVAQPTSDAKLKAEMEKHVFSLSEAYSLYTTKAGQLSRVQKYVLSGSPAETYFNQFDVKWVRPSASTKFEDMTSGNYIRYGSSTFSCDVKYRYIVQYSDKTKDSFDAAFTYFFTRSKGKWYLYDFVIS